MSSDFADAVELVKGLDEMIPGLERELQIVRSRVPPQVSSQVWRLHGAVITSPRFSYDAEPVPIDSPSSQLSDEQQKQISIQHRVITKHVNNEIVGHFNDLESKLSLYRNSMLEIASPAETPRAQPISDLRSAFTKFTREIDSEIAQLNSEITTFENQSVATILPYQMSDLENSLRQQDKAVKEISAQLQQLPSFFIAKQMYRPPSKPRVVIKNDSLQREIRAEIERNMKLLNDIEVEWGNERDKLSQTVLDIDKDLSFVETSLTRLEGSKVESEQRLARAAELHRKGKERLTKTSEKGEEIRKKLMGDDRHEDVVKLNEQVTGELDALAKAMKELSAEVDSTAAALAKRYRT
jgi:hypothetical protein